MFMSIICILVNDALESMQQRKRKEHATPQNGEKVVPISNVEKFSTPNMQGEISKAGAELHNSSGNGFHKFSFFICCHGLCLTGHFLEYYAGATVGVQNEQVKMLNEISVVLSLPCAAKVGSGLSRGTGSNRSHSKELKLVSDQEQQTDVLRIQDLKVNIMGYVVFTIY